MSYPEKGASYRNKPAWMDRAVAGEKRAQGGPVDDVDDNQRVASRDLDRGMRENVSNDGESQVRKSARGRLSSDPFEAFASGAYPNKSRTTMRDRADHQGPTYTKPKVSRPIEKDADAVEGYADGGTAQEAREQAAARTRRTRAMPNSFPVGGEPKEDRAEAAPMMSKETQDKIGRGLGQSIGFKRGGSTC